MNQDLCFLTFCESNFLPLPHSADNLNGVGRRSLAQLIAAAPQRDPLFTGKIPPQPADLNHVLIRTGQRRRVRLFVEDDAFRFRDRLTDFIQTDFPLGLIDSEWQRSTGTRTHVQLTRSAGS